MNLVDFYGENVKITAVNGNVYTGVVEDYIYPEDNENGKESIIVDTTSKDIVEFYENDIFSIELGK
uniref:LSM domain protein n=1 Tax=Siphoviridae sp. ctgEn20 TaxID=2825606 RepID=A0A8S5P4J6_9CAUD|nr:MAG TPA: hypothetical protein [Siphoviridae sp. ctgEn20]